MRIALLVVGLALFLIGISAVAFRLTGNLAEIDMGRAPLIFAIGCPLVAVLIGFFIVIRRRERRDGR